MKPEYKGLTEAFPASAFVCGERLDSHTTFRIGGEADCFVQPAGEEEMIGLLREAGARGIPCLVIGKGSNLLVSDDGFRGLVIQTGKLDRITVEGTCLRAEAGVSLARLAAFACEKGLAGLEFAHGIPGTLGGAVYMNAGAYGGEMAQAVTKVRVFRDGEILEFSGDEMRFGYRTSRLKEEGGTVLSVTLSLSKGDSSAIRGQIRDLDARRKEKQPLEYPSAGSFFKRPEGYFAGALIEQAGLKGAHIGDARVSEKHAGFIINTGKATCRDVLQLMMLVQEKVYADSGVHLEPEVLLIGGAP